ncbi:hypothetical protein ACIQGW_16020 [Lysinibacillus xylanilyticus]|uniref:hypothetical protein n=1 Tax=Lysinibacillus xylanilyticus TaxID=582475 RepID=UPI003809013E
MKKILAGIFVLGLSLSTISSAKADVLAPDRNGVFEKYNEHISEYGDIHNYVVYETTYDKKYSEKYQKDYNIAGTIYAFESKTYRDGEEVDSFYIYLNPLLMKHAGHPDKPIDGDTYLLVKDNKKHKFTKVINPNPSEEIKEEPKKKFKPKPKPKPKK